VVSPALLASGIWEALLTTAAGLTVAIPLMIFLHYFERKREKVGQEVEKYASLFVHLHEDIAEAARTTAKPDRPAIASIRG
jgi:biopolymer transport protein ExbB